VTDACDRVTAAQRVMRYVCHELRNPLHGLMVRDAVFRVSGVSLTFSLWQGVLEGVHADVAECTRCRATVDDLETIRDTGSNMAVILNDVLDLGQVGTHVYVVACNQARHSVQPVCLCPQLQRGKMKLEPVPTDFRLLIGQVVSTLLGVATVPIICKVAHTIPSAIRVDPLRFSQVGCRRHRVACRNRPDTWFTLAAVADRHQRPEQCREANQTRPGGACCASHQRTPLDRGV